MKNKIATFRGNMVNHWIECPISLPTLPPKPDVPPGCPRCYGKPQGSAPRSYASRSDSLHGYTWDCIIETKKIVLMAYVIIFSLSLDNSQLESWSNPSKISAIGVFNEASPRNILIHDILGNENLQHLSTQPLRCIFLCHRVVATCL